MKALDNGRYGAKVQSWSKSNPREILLGVINKMPGRERQEIFDEFWEKVKLDEAILMTIAGYWFTNNYYSLLDESGTRKKLNPLNIDEIKKTIKRRAAAIIFLDMVLPTGKKLRNSTGRECSKAGGLFLAIAKKVKPTDIVGRKLSEADVKKIFKSL